MAKRDVLKSSKYFGELGDNELAELEGIIQEKNLPPGTTLYLEGMLGESMYIIEEGNIKISKMIAEGEEQVLTVLGTGEHFGEMAVLDGGPRAASAVSTAETRVLTLKRKDFLELGKSKPDVCLKIMWGMVGDFSKRIRGNAEKYSKILTQASESS